MVRIIKALSQECILPKRPNQDKSEHYSSTVYKLPFGCQQEGK